MTTFTPDPVVEVSSTTIPGLFDFRDGVIDDPMPDNGYFRNSTITGGTLTYLAAPGGETGVAGDYAQFVVSHLFQRISWTAIYRGPSNFGPWPDWYDPSPPNAPEYGWFDAVIFGPFSVVLAVTGNFGADPEFIIRDSGVGFLLTGVALPTDSDVHHFSFEVTGDQVIFTCDGVRTELDHSRGFFGHPNRVDMKLWADWQYIMSLETGLPPALPATLTSGTTLSEDFSGGSSGDIVTDANTSFNEFYQWAIDFDGPSISTFSNLSSSSSPLSMRGAGSPYEGYDSNAGWKGGGETAAGMTLGGKFRIAPAFSMGSWYFIYLEANTGPWPGPYAVSSYIYWDDTTGLNLWVDGFPDELLIAAGSFSLGSWYQFEWKFGEDGSLTTKVWEDGESTPLAEVTLPGVLSAPDLTYWEFLTVSEENIFFDDWELSYSLTEAQTFEVEPVVETDLADRIFGNQVREMDTIPGDFLVHQTLVPSPAVETGTVLYDPDLHYFDFSSNGVLGLEEEEFPLVPPEFAITVLDPIIERGPGVVTIVVSGGIAEEEINFYIDGVLVWTTTLDAGGALQPASIGIFAGSSADPGVHVIEGRQEMLDATLLTAEATYEVLYAPYNNPTNAGPDADPVEVPEAVSHGVRHWVLQDLFPAPSGGIGSYVLPVNPSEMTSPHWENQFASRRTLAKGGQYHVFQVGRTVPEWKFSGYAPTQAMVDKLLEYRNLNRRFYIIDHFNRAWTVVITHVDLKARLRHNYNGELSDWGHDYEVTCLVLDQIPAIESAFSGAPGSPPIIPDPPPDPEVPETPEPEPDPEDPPPDPGATLYGSCPMKPGGESLAAALTVTTKWGSGAAVRQFKTNLSNPSVSAQFGLVHTSYKPNISSVLNGSLDATIRSIAMATPAGHVLEIWHEVDKKVRDGVDTRARLVAAKNRFYDQVKAVRPDVLVANTLTGWECSPTNSTTHGNIDQWADIKADVLGIDLDGIVPTSLPYTNYVDEINTAVDFVSRFATYNYWSVPEFGCPRISSDSGGTARAAWLTYYGNRFAEFGALYATLYEFDSTPNYSLTTAAELAAWNAFI